MGTQNANSNQWPRLVLSSSTTTLLMVGVLLPFCQLCYASAALNKLFHYIFDPDVRYDMIQYRGYLRAPKS